jgi:response regulator RpfG family c-di-GMP phosphodiesterase
LNLSPEFIAVIDDEEDIVKLFTQVIQMNGYFVIGFTNPLFLIDYTREFPHHIRLILIDYKLMEMTGCELANQIFAINPKIKMFLITAYNDVINNALNLEFVKKPIGISKIMEIVKYCMNNSVI